MANNTYIEQEGNNPISSIPEHDELKNRIIEVAANDLLDAMLDEQSSLHFHRSVMLRTPCMGECADIPKDKRGKIMAGEKFKFPEYYKKDIMKRFYSMQARKEQKK